MMSKKKKIVAGAGAAVIILAAQHFSWAAEAVQVQAAWGPGGMGGPAECSRNRT